MGKFSGVLLVADYDDTFYDHSFSISDQNRAAARRFMAQGGRFAIATGRSFVNFSIQMEVEKVPLNCPVVLANGASIYDFTQKKTLWEKRLPEEAPRHLEDLCARFPAVAFEAYHQDQVYTHRANSVTARHLARCRLTGIERPICAMPKPWLKVILQHEDTRYLEAVQAWLRAAWPEQYEVNFSNPVLLEVTAKGADKGFAVQWLADYLQVSPQHVYCVGNGVNDLPMLAVSAVPFAPGDCYPQVRDWGPVLLPDCDHHAVAALVDWLEARYPQEATASPAL